VGSLIVSLLALLPGTERVRYDGHAIVTAWVDDDAELATLRRVADELWSEHPGPGAVDARIAPARMAALERSGIEFTVRVADVQAQVDAEHTRLATRGPIEGGTWFSDFRDLAEIEAKVDELAAADPERVQIETIGESLEGRPIRALRIGHAADDAPAVLYSGTMHAREWLATMVTMCVADTFATSTDAAVLDVLDRIAVWVVPVVNPDGYEISWSYDRYWRKNARDGYGVDLNRNWAYQWAVVGSSSDPYAEDYHGDGPFSEPESTALRDLMIAQPQLVAHVDFHSYSQLILRPWGYTYDAPPDEASLAMLGQRMSDAMWSATQTDYPSIHAAELYPAAGAVDDWAYGERGLMAFTIEMRGDDFVVPPSQIDPACRENVAAAIAIAQWAAEMAPQGGDDDGGAEESGGGEDTGHEPPTDPGGDGESGGGDDGTGGDIEDDGDGGEGGEDDGGDGGDPDALPPGFGLGVGDASGCGCRSTSSSAAWMIAIAFAIARRRRHGT
jgi:MYXO-CTERM domain-containing protein